MAIDLLSSNYMDWIKYVWLYRLLIRLGVRNKPNYKAIEATSKKIRAAPELKINNMRMRFDPNSSQDRLMYECIVTGVGYEPGVTRILSQVIKKGTNFVDIGANSGYYTLLAASLLNGTGSITALEPQSEVYKRLKNNVKINKINNARLLHCAAFSMPKKVRIGIARWGDAETSIDYPDSTNYEEVNAVTVDDICKKPDVMKIDVEGYELEVLEGAKESLKKVKHIIFEQNIRRLTERNLPLNSVINYVRNHGFEVHDAETGKPIRDYSDAAAVGSNFYATRDD